MLAIQAVGAIPISLYQDATSAEVAISISNASVRFAVVENQEQVDKFVEVRKQCPDLERVWYDESRGLRNLREPGIESLDSLIAAGATRNVAEPSLFKAAVSAGRQSDVASLFFTSGTTGSPKGVVHTYAALSDRCRAAARFDHLDEKDEVLAFLPPAWIGQNIFSYAMWLVVGYVVNCPESEETVGIDLKEIGPTYYFAPPRVFEAFLTNVTIRMEDATNLKRRLFQALMAHAQRIGRKQMDRSAITLADRFLYAVGDLFVYGPLRNMLGMSRIRVAYTAGEAIGPELLAFYRSIGVNLKQLYGSTETAVFVCLQPDDAVHPDTVGVPVEGVQIRVAENGEILVRSPGMFREYFKNRAATDEVIDAEGWYHTGDAGYLASSGQLKIVDRAKDVGRLLGGSIFPPKYIENKLKFFPYIKEVVAFGDQRDSVCAIVNIDLTAVGSWAEKRNLSYTGYTDLAGKAEVHQLVRECVEKINADLASDELLAKCQVGRFFVLHKELDADDGELTRTRKVRRRHIAQKYAVLVDALHSQRVHQFVETPVRFEDGRTGVVSATLKVVEAKTFAFVKAAA